MADQSEILFARAAKEKRTRRKKKKNRQRKNVSWKLDIEKTETRNVETAENQFRV